MKASFVSALLFGSLASAIALPPYQIERRDTVTDEVVVTVTSTTTIYLDPTAAAAFFESQSAASLASELASELASSTAIAPSTTPSSVAASTTPTPPAASTPTPPATSAPPVQQAAQPATSAAPVPTPPAPTPAPAAPVAPTTTTPVAAPVATPAAVPAPAAAAPAASGGEVSGTGDITFYELSAGLTSCGGSYEDSAAVVALPIGVMNQYNPGNPNNNPLCGKTITITYKGATFTGTVVDSCGGCDNQSIDLSPSLFNAITGNPGLGRVSGVSWSVA